MFSQRRVRGVEKPVPYCQIGRYCTLGVNISNLKKLSFDDSRLMSGCLDLKGILNQEGS